MSTTKNKKRRVGNVVNRKNIAQHFTKKQKEPNIFLSIFITTIKMFIVAFLIMGFAGFGALLGVAKAYVDGTPTLDVGRIEDQSLTSFIYDMNGEVITEYKGLEHRIWAPLDEIPKTVQNALIATEDIRFYAHNGLDYKRLLGAFVNNLRSESVQGGSTLTQQLIKNTLLSPEQTYKRKIQEAYLAMQLEKEYSKEEILEAYLNTIYLGSGNYGVKAAAMNYFGKELPDLTLRESAVIVGITQYPYLYNPRFNFHTRNRPDITYKRANLVLRLMYENGFINKIEYETALFDVDGDGTKNEEFLVLEHSNHQGLYDMPYFIEYVIEDVIKALMQAKGIDERAGRNLLLTGGLHIYSTVDPKAQYAVQDAVYNYNNYPDTANPRDRIRRDTSGSRVYEIQQPQAAAVVLDHRTGELRAIVGGRSEPEAQGLFSISKSLWWPGSAIKPLSIYAPFIEAGYPGGIILEDIPVPIESAHVPGLEPYIPKNYNSKVFYGLVDARDAVVRSHNNSAARVIDRIGIEYSVNKLKELGITSSQFIEVNSVSNLALGGDGINLLELTAAYGTIANKGVYQEPISFTKVLDRSGNEIISNTSQSSFNVFKESTTFIMTEWLSRAVLTSSGAAGNSVFSNMSIAGKTGTSSNINGVNGAFFAGYTPYYTALVTIAPDRPNINLKGTVTGNSHAAPLWKRFMEPIHKGLTNIPFYDSIPEDVEKVTVCAISGKLPSDDCKKLITEYFPIDAVPTETCDMHVSQIICKYSGKLPSPFCTEDHYAKRPITVIRDDSPLQELTDEELNKYLPGAFRSYPDTSNLDPNNPEHKDNFCQLHNEQWRQAEDLRPGMAILVEDLIYSVEIFMFRNSSQLTNDNKAALNKAIKEVKDSLNNGKMVPPAEGEPYYRKIDYFNPAIVTTAMNNLENIHRAISNSLY